MVVVPPLPLPLRAGAWMVVTVPPETFCVETTGAKSSTAPFTASVTAAVVEPGEDSEESGAAEQARARFPESRARAATAPAVARRLSERLDWERAPRFRREVEVEVIISLPRCVLRLCTKSLFLVERDIESGSLARSGESTRGAGGAEKKINCDCG